MPDRRKPAPKYSAPQVRDQCVGVGVGVGVGGPTGRAQIAHADAHADADGGGPRLPGDCTKSPVKPAPTSSPVPVAVRPVSPAPVAEPQAPQGPVSHAPVPVRPRPSAPTPALPQAPVGPAATPVSPWPPQPAGPAAGGSGQGQPPPADLERIIEEACRFILERKQAAAKQVAWEVGEYLFERVYGGDLAYVERRDVTKPDSLYDIAARTGIGRLRLASWIRAYVARKYLGAAGVEVDLSMSNFEALRPLALHPEAARAVLELRARHHLTTRQLDALAVDWRRRLDEGGTLEDLVAAPLPFAVAPRAKAPRKRRPLSDADLVPIRLALVVQRWLRSANLAPKLRTSLRQELLRLRAIATSGSTSPPIPSGPSEPATSFPAPPAGPLPPIGNELAAPGDVVGDAVRFIQGCIRRRGLQFALEVGKYLFVHVYRGDRALYRNGGVRWQRDTIQTIADDPRVGLESSFLYKSIRAFLLVGVAGESLPDDARPELALEKWNALWPLEDDPQALVAVGTWAASERVPATTVAAVASLVAPYLERGGSLDDLLAGSRARPPDTPYRRIRRLLSVIEARVVRHPVSPAARPRLLAALDGCVGEAGKG